MAVEYMTGREWRLSGRDPVGYSGKHDPEPFERMVDHLEIVSKNGMPNKESLKVARYGLNVNTVMDSLPEGMSEQLFIDTVTLAMLTECNTDRYAEKIENTADRTDSPWLKRFNNKVWKPDEYQHTEPFKDLLLDLGVPESTLDAQIKNTQDTDFDYGDGHGRPGVTTFGGIQEYLTDHFHGLIARQIQKVDPSRAEPIFAIKRRETLHMVWYDDMTALQIGQDINNMTGVVGGLINFRLPGNSTIPELQAKAEQMMRLLGTDFTKLAKGVINVVNKSIGQDPRNGGILVNEVLSQQDYHIGPISADAVQMAFQKHARIGAAAQSLLGEAFLESVGLADSFKMQDKGIPGFVRAQMRTFLAGLIHNKIDDIFYKK